MNNARDFQIDDLILIEAQFAQDSIAVGAEIGRRARRKDLAIELDGRTDHGQRPSLAVVDILYVFIGERLDVLREFSGLLNNVPLSRLGGQRRPPLVQGT